MNMNTVASLVQTQRPDPAAIAASLRIGLRGLAKAVAVISCHDGSRRYAMSATAISELSMDPPSMLICVNRTASLYTPLSAGANFCINILQASQSDISLLCSGKVRGEARFSLGAWQSSPLGPPYLADAQSNIICRNVSRIEYGTHGIFLGEVEEVRTREVHDPLVYMDGRYGAFTDASRSQQA